MNNAEKLKNIANIIRDRLDDEGLVTIDENLGDIAETYQSILWLCTNGKEGKNWGIFSDHLS